MTTRNQRGFEMFVANMQATSVENLRDSKVDTVFSIKFEEIRKSGTNDTLNAILTDVANTKNRFVLNQAVFKLSHIYVGTSDEDLEIVREKMKWDSDLFFLSSNRQDEKASPQVLKLSKVLTLEQCFSIRPDTTVLRETTKLRLVHKILVHAKDENGKLVPKLQDSCYKKFEEFELKKQKIVARHRRQDISVAIKKSQIRQARFDLIEGGLVSGVDINDPINHLFGNIYELVND